MPTELAPPPELRKVKSSNVSYYSAVRAHAVLVPIIQALHSLPLLSPRWWENDKRSIHDTPAAYFGSALISSKIPPRCRGEGKGGAGLDGDGGGVILGIDEAGRGPVLGPMTYAAAYWSCADDEDVSSMGFDDSKALSPQQRMGLFDRIDAVRVHAVLSVGPYSQCL